MKTTFLALIGLILSFQQTSGQEQIDDIIQIRSDFDNVQSLKMSEVFSEIHYIPLETKPECLIGYMNIPVFGKDILINSNDGSESIFRFSDKGKFLNKIGTKGRGPGEYIDRKDVVLIGDKVFVVSNFSKSIYSYSLDGSFIEKFQLKFEGFPASIAKLSDNSFYMSLTNTCELGRLIKTGSSFEPQEGFFRNNTIRYTPHPLPISKTSSGLYYFYSVVDTIYEISKGVPAPAFILNHGKYNKPSEIKSIQTSGNEYYYNYPQITNCIISDSYLIASLFYMPKMLSNIVLFRISDGKTFNFKSLINNIDGGIPGNRNYHLTQDDNIVFNLKATEITKRLENMPEKERQDPNNSKFVEMAKRINPDSNPVLMVCKLK